jgi:cytochrome b561
VINDKAEVRRFPCASNAHFYLAFAFFALVLLHLAAALFHALVRRDGVFESMAPVPSRDEVAPAE